MADHVARFYDRLAFAYPVFDLFLGSAKRRLISRINEETPGPLLEIGVGRGDNLPIYKHGPVTGVDVSEGMLAFARKKAPADCSLHVMDARNLEFPDGAFSYCVLSYVLSVVDDPCRVMDEVFRVVSPGGKIFILNHESRGEFKEMLNKHVLRHFSRFLHFSAVFDMGPVVDETKFSKVHRGEYGFLPTITMLVLERKEN